jgi:hypothetical protein
MGVGNARFGTVDALERTPGREVWKSECARGCGAKHETTENAMIESRIKDTKPPVVERPGLVEAGIGGDPLLPSSTVITSAGMGCSEQQEAGPRGEMASASPRDRSVEGTIRSVAEDAECARLERVSVAVEEGNTLEAWLTRTR